MSRAPVGDSVASPDTIRALIADDEAPARARLATLIGAESGFEIVAVCANGRQALAAMEDQRPDVAFLDIRMPGLGGFDVVQQMDFGPLPAIVFVTAFDEFAVAAFEANALDYLLKPYSRARLSATLARVRERVSWVGRSGELEKGVRELLATLSAHTPTQPSHAPVRIPIPGGRRTTFLQSSDIVWLEARRNYVRIHAPDRHPLIRSTLEALVERLGPDFARIHRSHAVNLAAVVEVHSRPAGGFRLVLSDGARLNVSERYHEEVRRMLIL